MANDLISRSAAIDAVYYKPSYKMAIEVLKEVPAVDAVPVVHARWLIRDRIYRVAYCSNCDFELKISDTKYCPECGARMDGGDEKCD